MRVLPLKEGTWFTVPLRSGGFAVGVLARKSPKGGVILAYFFGPKRSGIPQLTEVEQLNAGAALRALRVGDLSLLDGSWTPIGSSQHWNREEWPVPDFVRRDELSRRAWRVTYSDSDPNLVLAEQEIPYDSAGLERDAMLGSGAAELLLTKLLQ